MRDNDGKIQRKLIFLVVIITIMLVLAVALSNFTHAQEIRELHQLTNHTGSSENAHIELDGRPTAVGVIRDKIYVTIQPSNTTSVIEATNNTKIAKIPVGEGPRAIGIDGARNRVYVANSDNDTVSVIDGLTNTKIRSDIKVGGMPVAIGINEAKGRVYVANYRNDTVSIISEEFSYAKPSDIKVGDGNGPYAIGIVNDSSRVYVANLLNDTVSEIIMHASIERNDIKVGHGPIAIGVNEARNIVYVVNSYNDTVSVINATNNTKIGDDIKVGHKPSAIGVYQATSMVYVANADNDTVSVIDGRTNTNTGHDIKVGHKPSAIGVNNATGTVYVANSGSNTLSVIDGNENKLVAGVTFDVKPFNAGHIECYKDKIIAPTTQQFYLLSGSECTAKPNEGFEFVSWQENLPKNSTQLLSVANPPTFFDSILDFLHLKPDKPESKLNITKFGSFTANFKALPPPIPPEYVATLITVVATAFIGTWLTPTIIGWRKTKKQGSKLDSYRDEVKKLYRYDYNDDDGELYRKDIKKLNDLRDDITGEYMRGKINKEQYDELGDEISINFGEIFTKEINSLNNLSEDNHKEKRLSAVKSDIEEIHAKGRLNNEYYKLLNEKISDNKNNQQSKNNQLASSSQNYMSISTNQGSPIKS